MNCCRHITLALLMLNAVVHMTFHLNLLLLPPPLPHPFSCLPVPPPKFTRRAAVWRNQLPGAAISILRPALVVVPPLRLMRRQCSVWRRQRCFARARRRRVQGSRARCTCRRGGFTGEIFEGSNFGPAVQKQAVRTKQNDGLGNRVGDEGRRATGRHALEEGFFGCKGRARCDAAHLAAADRDSGGESCWCPAAASAAASTTREAAAATGSSSGAPGKFCADSARSMLCSTAS